MNKMKKAIEVYQNGLKNNMSLKERKRLLVDVQESALRLSLSLREGGFECEIFCARVDKVNVELSVMESELSVAVRNIELARGGIRQEKEINEVLKNQLKNAENKIAVLEAAGNVDESVYTEKVGPSYAELQAMYKALKMDAMLVRRECEEAKGECLGFALDLGKEREQIKSLQEINIKTMDSVTNLLQGLGCMIRDIK